MVDDLDWLDRPGKFGRFLRQSCIRNHHSGNLFRAVGHATTTQRQCGSNCEHGLHKARSVHGSQRPRNQNIMMLQWLGEKRANLCVETAMIMTACKKK